MDGYSDGPLIIEGACKSKKRQLSTWALLFLTSCLLALAAVFAAGVGISMLGKLI
jgi:hypothetical protein